MSDATADLSQPQLAMAMVAVLSMCLESVFVTVQMSAAKLLSLVRWPASLLRSTF